MSSTPRVPNDIIAAKMSNTKRGKLIRLNTTALRAFWLIATFCMAQVLLGAVPAHTVLSLGLSGPSQTSLSVNGVPVVLTLKNNTNHDVVYSIHGPMFRALTFKVEDPCGNVLAERDIISQGRRYSPVLSLTADASTPIPLRVDAWVPITRPGKYKITALLDVVLDDPRLPQQSPLVSPSITIDVQP